MPDGKKYNLRIELFEFEGQYGPGYEVFVQTHPKSEGEFFYDHFYIEAATDETKWQHGFHAAAGDGPFTGGLFPTRRKAFMEHLNGVLKRYGEFK